MYHQIKAVIFDMDGVIFDTEKAVIEVWKVVAKKHGIPDIESFCKECIGTNAVMTKISSSENMVINILMKT